MYFKKCSSVSMPNAFAIAPYYSASFLVICRKDSICALFYVNVELVLASASLMTTGALICAWLICVCISMITFCCVCFTVILSWMATLVDCRASSYFYGRSALLSWSD